MSGAGAQALIVGGTLTAVAAGAHLACIVIGARAYRLMGAGEHMARAAQEGKIKPTLVTLAIAAVLLLWAAYAFSGAGLIIRLPFTGLVLALASAVYLARAVGFPLLKRRFPENTSSFWLWSSGICLILGLLYGFGSISVWRGSEVEQVNTAVRAGQPRDVKSHRTADLDAQVSVRPVSGWGSEGGLNAAQGLPEGIRLQKMGLESRIMKQGDANPMHSVHVDSDAGPLGVGRAFAQPCQASQTRTARPPPTMHEDPKSSDYLVLSRGTWDEAKTSEEIQGAIDDFYRWHERSVEQGRMKPGKRLAVGGKLVTKSRIVDGPFTEAKEVIGGYWFVVAGSLEEAAAIISENPCIACGLEFEVRPVAPERASAYVTTNETPATRRALFVQPASEA